MLIESSTKKLQQTWTISTNSYWVIDINRAKLVYVTCFNVNKTYLSTIMIPASSDRGGKFNHRLFAISTSNEWQEWTKSIIGKLQSAPASSNRSGEVQSSDNYKEQIATRADKFNHRLIAISTSKEWQEWRSSIIS